MRNAQPGSGEHAHTTLPSDGGALRVVVISSLILAGVAAIELVAAALSNSAGVLADGLHNLGDVSSTIALAVAFIVSRRRPSQRFPYGYDRGEDLAGLLVLGLIVASAVVSAVTSVDHLLHQPPLQNILLAMVVAFIGFLGNEAAAQYKIRAGGRLHSVALVADGKHSRVDGLASLGAMVGVAGAAVGVPVLDPIAGLGITVIIAGMAWETGRNVIGHLLDEADPALVSSINTVAESTPGVRSVTSTRARWTGRRVRAALTLELAPDIPLEQAHAVGETVRHRLYHEVDALIEVMVHIDPTDAPRAHEAVAHHSR